MATGTVVVLAAVLLLAGCATPGGHGPATYVDPTPGPAVTHPPRFDEAEPAVRALGALIARKDLGYHVMETVSTSGGGIKATIDLDVAGTDFAAKVAIPGTTAFELRHVGGATFARVGKKKWMAGTADAKVLEDLADPWLYLCWLDDLAYLGPAEGVKDGLAFACRKPYTYQSSTMRRTGDVGNIETLALVLLPDGTPVRMELSGSGPTLATGSATFRATYGFSRVDEPIVIKVPKT